MIQAWIIYWFCAVLIYAAGKMLKHKPTKIAANIIAIALAAYATYLMVGTLGANQ